MRYYEITNERTGEKIRVKGDTIPDCAVNAKKKMIKLGWTLDDSYHSERVLPRKWSFEWIKLVIQAKRRAKKK